MRDADPVSEIDEWVIGLEVPKVRKRDVCPVGIIELADVCVEDRVEPFVIKLDPLAAGEVLIDELQRGALAVFRAERTDKLANHPKNVYLPEAALVGPLNEWLARLFNEDNLDTTVASLTASQSIDRGRNAAQQRLHDAEARVRRLQAAIAAGVDPAALVEAINETQAQSEAAQVELQHTAAPDAMSSEDIFALIKSLGEIRASAQPRRSGAPRAAVRGPSAGNDLRRGSENSQCDDPPHA